jgi:hypothetical protein
MIIGVQASNSHCHGTKEQISSYRGHTCNQKNGVKTLRKSVMSVRKLSFDVTCSFKKDSVCSLIKPKFVPLFHSNSSNSECIGVYQK